MAKDSLKAKFNFSWAQLNTLITTLNELRRWAQRGTLSHPRTGICRNWAALLEGTGLTQLVYGPETNFNYVGLVKLVSGLSLGWNHPLNTHPGEDFFIADSPWGEVWTGPYLEARISMIRHMARQLCHWRRQQELVEIREQLALRLPPRHRTRQALRLYLEVLEQLEHLAKEGQVPHPHNGICCNWGELLGNEHASRGYTLVESLSAFWPKTTGNLVLPIPTDLTKSHWHGKNLDLRLDLIRFMAVRLRALSRVHDSQE